MLSACVSDSLVIRLQRDKVCMTARVTGVSSMSEHTPCKKQGKKAKKMKQLKAFNIKP